MCGIAGIITKNGSRPDERILDKLANAIEHRGPDGKAKYITEGVGFVQTRLAIIDVEGGNQPFYAGDSVLVANGEIYNYLELKKELPDITFSSESDCEVPLHLYNKSGLDFAEKLRGMYAIAIHDKKENRVIITKDPFGIKPLYYAENPEFFIFASEAQAIIASGLVTPELNTKKAVEMLQLQFTTGEQTVFKGIKRLMAGQTIVVEKASITNSFIINALPEADIKDISEKEALEQLDSIFEDSVDIHQRSDVPFGMFLSGGVDSSAVLATMEKLNSNPVLAYTAGFSDSNVHDERSHAADVAKKAGAEHIEIDVGKEDFLNRLPEIAAAIEDPVADYAVIPTYLLAERARKDVKVILSGEGGDELFAGYGRYRSANRLFFAKKMRRKGRFDSLDILKQSENWRDDFSKIENLKLANTSRLQNAQRLDIADWLPNDLLNKLDRCLMANAIEGRVPFLDLKVAEFAFNLPDSLKVKGKKGKWILRKWLEEKFPVSAPFAPKKGFTVPVAEWLKDKKLGELVAEQPVIKELCHYEKVSALFTDNGKKAGFAAWTLLFFALWHKRHIELKETDGNIFDVLAK